jgi:nucleotide-binding universal stress UspA family protein
VKTDRAVTGAKSSGGAGRARKAVTKTKRSGGDHRINLLVVVDVTEASKRVLQYVSRFATRCDGPEFHLAYITSHLPPELMETGGAELPEREAQLESTLWREQRGWMAVEDKKARTVLRAAQRTLQRAGLAASRIHICVSSPLDARRAVDEVLLLAQDQRCGTIVIGHRAHSWFRGLGSGDLTDQLLRRAKGYAVWVID